ncbi:MAG TPA: ABC transporter ATP-binding protein [Caldimonas sp.]|nr:ABC transporter ATP-binding protein [Caldimonas sp.]
MTVIRVDKGSVTLGSTEALREVTLEVSSGWSAIVGPNGAGKSTLLRAMAGLQALRRGQVSIDGRSLAEMAPDVRGGRLAWLSQQTDPTGELTVGETVALGRLPSTGLFGAVTADDRRLVEQAMRDAGCLDARHRRLQELSGGERQRVYLARALAVGAPLLLLDEPTTHLDPPYQVAFVRLLRDQVRAGVTVVSVLHDLSLALLADRLVIMDRGRIRSEGPSDDPEVHRHLVDVFDGAVRIVRFDERWIVIPQVGA